MCKRLLTERTAVKLFEDANRMLGYDLLSLCLNGPVEELNKTVNCQPAIVVASLAALQDERLKGTKVFPDWPDEPDTHTVTAGFSVGEVSALIFSGALSFEDGLKVVQVRAQAMQEASDQQPSGMVSIMGPADLDVQLLCDTAKEWSNSRGTQEPVACVANYLFPGGWVLGGDKSSVQYIVEFGKAKHGIKKAQLIPVSGAFHTKLMTSAQEPLRRVLESVNIQTPRCTVYSGTSCEPLTNPDQIKSLLVRQLVEPVNWMKTIQNIFKERTSSTKIYEVGPGRQLKAMINRIDRTLLDDFTNLET
ncbi:hypothetical protein ACROYT_G011823 [Oculina patagonica]